MNKRETEYFELLRQDREESASMLEKPSMRGIKDSVVEKYSDQAHFIYELLQNADDAGASSVEFKLQKRRLLFSHNGTRHFSISNPRKENLDAVNGTLGDINAITAIANSSKGKESTIGKFGVGFKAVFQYTMTPQIYDEKFRFQISRFIVPSLIENDFAGREKTDTLFVFPFDHPARTKDEAVEEISGKLDTLVFPLLFMNNLKEIRFECPNHTGRYEKNVEEQRVTGDIVGEKIVLTRTISRTSERHKLWMFSRKYQGALRYSVCFFLDEKNRLKEEQYNAFCYFSTKETTGLNFLIHAPFLLTDSREGIRVGAANNVELIRRLAALSADSLLILRDVGKESGTNYLDENIFKIIPYQLPVKKRGDEKSLPWEEFHNSIYRLFRYEKVFWNNGEYKSAAHAYWAGNPSLHRLVKDYQLQQLINDKDAFWAFPQLGRQDRAKVFYIERVIRSVISDDNLLNRMSGKFIENQTQEWLSSFYTYITENAGRVKRMKSVPIFLDQDRRAVAAYSINGQEILFLPNEDVSGYRMINSGLMKLESARTLVRQMELRKPSLEDEIFNLIVPQYQNNCIIDAERNLKAIYKYYRNCSKESETSFVGKMSFCRWIKYYTLSGEKGYCLGKEVYFYSEDLDYYFDHDKRIRYVDTDEYNFLPGMGNEMMILLEKVGVRSIPALLESECPASELENYAIDIPEERGINTRGKRGWIHGLEEALQRIEHCEDLKLSVILWEYLLRIIQEKKDCLGLENFMALHYSVEKRRRCIKEGTITETRQVKKLKESEWLFTIKVKKSSPIGIQRKQLSKKYDLKSEYADELLKFLGIMAPDSLEGMMDQQQKEQWELASMLLEAGVTNAELQSFLKKRSKKKQNEKKRESEAKKRELADDILSLTPKRLKKEQENTEKSVSGLDEDEYTPAVIDFSRKIEIAKQKSADEIDRIIQVEELQAKAASSGRYSFGWFKALLELELKSSGSEEKTGKEIDISFGAIEREKNTEKIFVLSKPNRYIPHVMEDLADIPMQVITDEDTMKVVIEAANINSYTLRVRLKDADEMNRLNLDAVNEIKISVKNPAFLQEELLDNFSKLALDDAYDMQENLCENIEFIFGPPGTGKTTYLAEKVLHSLMVGKTPRRVLVLTPTNTAADVLTQKLLSFISDTKKARDWIVRFGTTNDPVIEQSGVYREKDFPIKSLERYITITTIARFPYDYFMENGEKALYLRNMKWDYIVFDEASMISLVDIIYPLYKQTPKKFIIAGDPFQIEPITTIDLWKNENIYTLVNLDSFSDIQTVPHHYKVRLLTKQYRSIPEIGEVYSQLMYDGKIKHHRTRNSRKRLQIKGIQGIKPVNIIKFPVSKYESIYRAKRLSGKSNYQIYSALFMYEFIDYIQKNYRVKDDEQKLSVGIIAPYKAQADLIEKLLVNSCFSKNFSVEVGTIHSFQGGECDIIFVLFNPPRYISSSRDIFLNKKSIINVAISRARDYLFILMPDDETENIEKLSLVKRVEQICTDTDVCAMMDTQNLEKKIFGKKDYIESNAFSTSHQSVNVYYMPEMKYEIRSEENAVDIQIHDEFTRPK